ncbi:MAG: transporter substrate-binding domain-containing protein [Desulfobacter sp.]|nr:MAG: transporter substrate-binding domain-containing protein [Desulfobacter sp.]
MQKTQGMGNILRAMICLPLLLLVFPMENAAPQTLKFFQTDNRYEYRIELLTLAMDKTMATDGPYELEPFEAKMTHKRGLSLLERGTLINIVFLPATREMESRFLSVKTPILLGLLGCRIFIIRKKDRDDFSKIASLNQLKTTFMAGFGNQWADMKILEANQIPVIGTAQYENLFHMLSRGRFDYFPRGINEAFKEVKTREASHPDLMVEPGLALYYPYPVYFYVNYKDVRLADRIKRGLDRAKADGSFRRLFFRYHNEIIRKAGLNNRKVFTLTNPTLPDDIPRPNVGSWMDPALGADTMN